MPNQKLRSILAPKNQILATYIVHAVAKYYPDMVRVYIPNKPYEKLNSGYEQRNKKKRKIREKRIGTSSEGDIDRSIRRSKKTVKDYILCNNFELFATFTFAKDRQDTNKCRAKLANWIKNERNRKGIFQYLIVPEYHKDGRSLHFHALIKGYKGKLESAVNKGKPIFRNNNRVYQFPSYTSGYTTVIRIIDTKESHRRVGNYVGKYLTKGMPLFFNKNRYWVSSGLKTPKVIENPNHWYQKTSPVYEITNEYGVIRNYDRRLLDLLKVNYGG